MPAFDLEGYIVKKINAHIILCRIRNINNRWPLIRNFSLFIDHPEKFNLHCTITKIVKSGFIRSIKMYKTS